MVICTLDALKKYSKKKEIVEVLQQAVERDQDDEILGFDLRFVG